MYPILKNRIFKYVIINLFICFLFASVQSLPAQDKPNDPMESKSGITEEKAPSLKGNGIYGKFSYYKQKIIKSSVAVSMISTGFKSTKELYNQKMRGQGHPSRVLARAVIGFGGLVAAALFFARIFWVSFSLIPFAGGVLGPIMGILGLIGGGVIGAIGAEWLFELIMPLQGAGSRIRNSVLGGVLGGIVGALSGVLMELSLTSNQKGGFFGFISSLTSSLLSAFSGLVYGFILGGLIGLVSFFYIFT
jgi:hypothetical protein